MKVAVLGTGIVGQTIAGALVARGLDVMVGTRDVASTMGRTEVQPTGAPAFSVWHQQNPNVQIGTFEEAARFGEVVVNASSGTGSLDALQLAGEVNLDGKVLMDLSNPLDFSQGMPPTLSVSNTDSLGEQIQRAFPRARVVKTLNTVTASLMVNPGLVASAEHVMFVCGDDGAAKEQVAGWLKEWFGWKNIIDLGDITNARGTEMYLPLWLRLWGALGTGMFNVQVVQ